MAARAFDPVAHARAMRADGFWPDRTVDEYLLEAIAATPTKRALTAYRVDRDAPRTFSYRELGDRVARAAAGLRALGVGPGDVVAIQLPNWWEFVVTALACGRIGAVVNPLMPIFRQRELGYMLGFAEARVLVVPSMFRGFDHAAMAAALKNELPSLRQVIVVDGENEDSFDARLQQGGAQLEAGSGGGGTPLHPDDPAVVMFTSGTTGSPKGVMHSSNTLLACTVSLAGRFGLDGNDVLHACSPMGHMTGYAAVMLLAVRLGATMVLQDVWDARRGVTMMAAEGATYTAASTPFLNGATHEFADPHHRWHFPANS